MRSSPRWVSASDLAEYAYCPRALFYRRRSPDAPETPAESSGRRYHARTLGAERRRADRPAPYWVGLLVGALIAVVGAMGAVRP